MKLNRREFLSAGTAAGGSLLLPQSPTLRHSVTQQQAVEPVEPAETMRNSHGLPDLKPARWIWFPSGRTLPNTFILFRRELKLPKKPMRATGWICADSRYRFEVNGQRVQWGPAPSDPRWPEADPLDLTGRLQVGMNALAATVLFYGEGDGASALGRPGFLFWLELEYAGGQVERVVSNARWQVQLCRAWVLGHPKRWYLRALQEEFDARHYPYGWSQPGFNTDSGWLPAMELNGSPNQPALCTDYHHYSLELDPGPNYAELRRRSIPMLRESLVAVKRLSETYWLDWQQRPEDYFDFRIPDAFRAESGNVARESGPEEWTVNLSNGRAAALTFEFVEQIVGWPSFTIEAPAGTVVELLVQEAHALGGPPLLNTHFDSWTRFICREGKNDFETFDFESLRWLQLHIRSTRETVRLSNLRVRRRAYPWSYQPQIVTNDSKLNRLFGATVNTLVNCAQETLVDGMARERQQYSGDAGHQIHALHLACGAQEQVARYLATWSQGMTKDGYFLDCWPGYDRLARLEERQLDLTQWGPLLDHGVGFNFDCWYHYLYTSDLDALREPYPRLLRFATYLQELIRSDGLLPVEDIGIPTVWLDHVAYQRQRHKQCAFNLYVAAAMESALAPLCRTFGNSRQADAATHFGHHLRDAAIRSFWSSREGKFVNNLPWLDEELLPRTCDRSLATSILFDQCPDGQIEGALRSLVECPPEMGFSYPANACWRLWALAKGGRGDVIIDDLRQRWAIMNSVKLNNTLQEDWHSEPDSSQQWSHCPVVPVYIAFQGLMGLKPLEPGFHRYEIQPQLGDLDDIELTAFTIQGEIAMKSQKSRNGREITLKLPSGCQGELVLQDSESVELPESPFPAPASHRRFVLPAGRVFTFEICHG